MARLSLSLGLLLTAIGCGGGAETPLPPAGVGMAGAHNGGNAGSGGSGSTSDEAIALPMIVDFYFFPSGAFGRLIDVGADGSEDNFAEGCDGDDSGEWDNVAIDQTETACPLRPQAVLDDVALALSRCSSFAFTPVGLDAVDLTTWAGVLWQNTPCNWGADPGSFIEASASKITFWAWGNAASVGSSVVFQAGGIGTAGTPYRDLFTVTRSVVLSATPTLYEMDLSNANYAGSSGVISAIGWTAERTDLSALTFYVDGMRWE